MFPLTIRRWIIVFVFVLLGSCASGHDRKLSSKANPGCSACSTDETLIYIKADGKSDVIHQIWDFTQGIPTVIFAVGSLNSTLEIQWNGVTPKNFNFSEKPAYSFGLALDKLYEYNDLEDNAMIDPRVDQQGFSLDHLTWTNTAISLTEDEVMVVMEARDFRGKGIITVKLDLVPYKDYAVDLPHLIHTANSTLLDLSIVDLPTSSRYNASRYAWRGVLISTDAAMDSMYSVIRRSLDDEHTPGVFEVVEITTPESHEHGLGGYMQLRPVAYRSAERSVGTSTIAHVSDLRRSELPHHSTIGNFYQAFDKDNLLVEEVFVSFGEPGDGFYRQHNYTAWSFTLGYGAPPVEGFSLFVILVISIGLGVPVALSLSAVAYVCVRRARQNNNRHRRFEDQ